VLKREYHLDFLFGFLCQRQYICEISMQNDATLIRQFAAEKCEFAFTELVRRHADLVYTVALRRVRGNSALAQDITQSVFIDLARKAPRLPPDVVLVAWLHRATQLASISVSRAEMRRSAREQQAITMHEWDGNEPSPRNEGVSPILDEALDQLNDPDRQALLLRFFSRHSLREVGSALGVSEDAARMRVDRALDKLRGLLAKRGIRTTATAFSLFLTANAVQAAPAGFVTTLTCAALAAVAKTTSISTLGLLNFMASTKLKIGIAALVAVSAAAPIVLQHQKVNQFRLENSELRKQLAVSATASPPNQSTNSGAHFSWASLESTNYLQYIGNLKRMGCPDVTIADLIIGEVNRIYARRTAELNRTFLRKPYWQSRPSIAVRHDPAYATQFRNLMDEKQMLIKQLVGVDIGKESEQITGDLTTLSELEFLPESRRAEIDALRQASFDKWNAVIKRSNGHLLPSDNAELKTIKEALEQDLRAHLTVQEYRDYQLRFSDIAETIRRNTKFFRPTESEFLALYDTSQEHERILLNNSLSEAERARAMQVADAKLIAALGEDRFNHYQRTTDQHYEQFARLAESHGLPEATVRTFYDTYKELLRIRGGIVSDTNLDSEARRAQLEKHNEHALIELRSIFSEEAFRTFLQLDKAFVSDNSK
jgi:RNA polymerase sigma factor (sigma-70 family)